MVFYRQFLRKAYRLAKHMLSYPDNEVHLIGTSKLSVMDTTNLENIREAIRELSRNNVERKQRIFVPELLIRQGGKIKEEKYN